MDYKCIFYDKVYNVLGMVVKLLMNLMMNV